MGTNHTSNKTHGQDRFGEAARREPRSLEAAGTRGLWVSRESDWGGSRVNRPNLDGRGLPSPPR